MGKKRAVKLPGGGTVANSKAPGNALQATYGAQPPLPTVPPPMVPPPPPLPPPVALPPPPEVPAKRPRGRPRKDTINPQATVVNPCSISKAVIDALKRPNSLQELQQKEFGATKTKPDFIEAAFMHEGVLLVLVKFKARATLGVYTASAVIVKAPDLMIRFYERSIRYTYK